MFPKHRIYKVKARIFTFITLGWIAFDFLGIGLLAGAESSLLKLAGGSVLFIHAMFVVITIYLWVKEPPQRKATTAGLYGDMRKIF